MAKEFVCPGDRLGSKVCKLYLPVVCQFISIPVCTFLRVMHMGALWSVCKRGNCCIDQTLSIKASEGIRWSIESISICSCLYFRALIKEAKELLSTRDTSALRWLVVRLSHPVEALRYLGRQAGCIGAWVSYH